MAKPGFPILVDRSAYSENLNAPACIPWELVTPHEEQAMRNHRQTLSRLAERGGLSPMELYAVMTDSDYRALFPDESPGARTLYIKSACDYLNGLVAPYLRTY